MNTLLFSITNIYILMIDIYIDTILTINYKKLKIKYDPVQ